MNDLLKEYGGIVSLIALTLTFPLAVLANLITPKVRDWFARKSKNRIEKRISNIKHSIALCDMCENDFSLCIRLIGKDVAICVSQLIFSLMSFTALLHSNNIYLTLSYASICFPCLFFSQKSIFKLIEMVNLEVTKRKLQKRIDDLEKHLSK